jgi:tRNA (cytosine49-C5)-methyltransferase
MFSESVQSSSPTAENIFPPDFLQRLQSMVPSEKYSQILQALSKSRVTTLRVNTLKTTATELVPALAEAGFELQSVPWLPGAFILTAGTLFDLTTHPLYEAGHVYVQGLSSMIPAVVLNPQPGESVLDLAAAPGSKTTQMAVMMNNQGKIVANDTSTIRLFKLKANLERQAISNVEVRRGPGQDIWHWYPEQFDKTLVDVPCSMEGRFNAQKPKTWEDWSLFKVTTLAQRQQALLLSALFATKPGGQIVYSTCTLAPEENELVIEWLLRKFGDVVELEKVEVAGSPLSPGLSEWQGKAISPVVSQNVARIWPTTEVEGFFVAKLRKTNSQLDVLTPLLEARHRTKRTGDATFSSVQGSKPGRSGKKFHRQRRRRG